MYMYTWRCGKVQQELDGERQWSVKSSLKNSLGGPSSRLSHFSPCYPRAFRAARIFLIIQRTVLSGLTSFYVMKLSWRQISRQSSVLYYLYVNSYSRVRPASSLSLLSVDDQPTEKENLKKITTSDEFSKEIRTFNGNRRRATKQTKQIELRVENIYS